jgi:glycosyltransferase involved in cell wall biosynthesis
MMVANRAPNRLAAVFHGGLAPELEKCALETRALVSKPNLALSDLWRVVAGADVGLVFYEPNNPNNCLVGHASGQLALYLQCGVPVIVNEVGSLASLVRRYRCGMVVQEERDIFSAAEAIFREYDQYCERALDCFRAEHDLSRPHEAVMARLAEIAGQDPRSVEQ